MTEIQITRTKDEPGATTLSVEAPIEVVQEAEKKAAAYYAKRVKLRGFRKGKAPPDVVRKRFGQAIRETVIQELVRDSWKQAVESESLTPVADPEVHRLKFEADQPVTFELLVETKPEVTLDRVSGFTITRKEETISDAMVAQQIDQIRQQKAPWVPVQDGKPKSADLVHVTIITKNDDGSDEEKTYDIVLGQNQALPAVEEVIMQIEVGAEQDTSITFPPDFPDETKRGQSMSMHVTVHECKRQVLPELTDDFAREVGDFETVEDLRQSVRSDMERAAAREADSQVRRDLLEQISAANNVPAPRPMVNRMLRAYAEAYQVPQDGFERFVTEFGSIVEHQVKRELIVQGIAAKESLAATEEELDDRIAAIAKDQNTDAAKVYAALQRDNKLRDLERDVTETKVFDFLIGQSTVKTQ